MFTTLMQVGGLTGLSVKDQMVAYDLDAGVKPLVVAKVSV